MRRFAPGILAAALAVGGCGSVEPAARPSGPAGDRVLERYGIQVELPPGWHGELGRGALRVANVPRDRLVRGEPLPAGVVRLDLFETDPDHDSPPVELAAYRQLDVAPSLDVGDFGPPEPGTSLAAGEARRLFSLSGRLFVLFVSSGTSPPPAGALAAVNRLLASFAVEEGDFYPGTVEPPRFTPRPGWHVGDSGPRDVRADGDWLTAWAATVPYADPWNGLPPQRTLARLDRDGIVIWIGLDRNNRSPPTEPRHAPAQPPFRLADFQRLESWEGRVGDVPEYRLWATLLDRYHVDLRVFFGRPEPTPAMLAEAQALLDGLRLPDWGPWELEP